MVLKEVSAIFSLLKVFGGRGSFSLLKSKACSEHKDRAAEDPWHGKVLYHEVVFRQTRAQREKPICILLKATEMQGC